MSEELEIKSVTISPDEAALILERSNIRNRPITKSVVETYAKEMRDGTWLQTGQTITFGIDGRLLDGQHRLAACVASGVPLSVIMVEGVDPSAQMNMDRGKKRQFGDHLKIVYDEVHTLSLAALVRATLTFQISEGRLSGRVPGRNSEVSFYEMDEWYRKHADALREASAMSRRLATSELSRFPQRVIGLPLFAALSSGLSEEAGQFAYIVRTGDAPQGDAALALRDKGISWRLSKARPPWSMQAAVAISAWNRWVAGETVSLVRASKNPVHPIFGPDGELLMPFGISEVG